MNKNKVVLEKILLIGITARTNNKNEMNPATAQIAQTAGNYFSNQVPNQIKHKKNSGVTYAVYTNYESDEHGDYTYFIGEEVTSLDNQDEKLTALTIMKNNYQRFTTPAGKMPDVVIAAWQTIWKMDSAVLGGNRNYRADFELYDQRAMDPANTVVDIYIGVN